MSSLYSYGLFLNFFIWNIKISNIFLNFFILTRVNLYDLKFNFLAKSTLESARITMVVIVSSREVNLPPSFNLVNSEGQGRPDSLEWVKGILLFLFQILYINSFFNFSFYFPWYNFNRACLVLWSWRRIAVVLI
jgi:hypothetical protein